MRKAETRIGAITLLYRQSRPSLLMSMDPIVAYALGVWASASPPPVLSNGSHRLQGNATTVVTRLTHRQEEPITSPTRRQLEHIEKMASGGKVSNQIPLQSAYVTDADTVRHTPPHQCQTKSANSRSIVLQARRDILEAEVDELNKQFGYVRLICRSMPRRRHID